MIALVLAACLAVQEPRFEPDLADWEARDLEGRWAVIERETRDAGSSSFDPLVAFLEGRRELELLEWLCLYPRVESFASKPLAALQRLDAPQWARAALWVSRDRDSHTFASGYETLSARPGLAVDWLRRHESRLPVPLETVLEQLGEGALAAPEDSSRLLPPWSDDEALAHLIAPAEVADFGELRRAAAGVTYLHQIERELRAVAHAQIHGAPWLERIVELTRHARPEVRSFAWIALGEARRGAISPRDLPDATFESAVGNAAEDPRVRTAALLALSRRADWSPGAWYVLHEVALDPEHPAWAAALERLREIGDGFTLRQLVDLEPRVQRDDVRREALAGAVAALRKLAGGAPAAEDVAPALERTAWMDLTHGRFEAQRQAWTRSLFPATRRSAEVAAELARIAAGYEVAADLAAVLEARGLARAFGERVRGAARGIVER